MSSSYKLRAYVELCISHYFAEDLDEAIKSFEEHLNEKFQKDIIVSIRVKEDDEKM